MNAGEVEALKGYRAAVAALTARYGDVGVSVAEVIADADPGRVIFALADLANDLLRTLHPSDAQRLLESWATGIAEALAAVEQTEPGRDREAT